jgi:hypothetical protein
MFSYERKRLILRATEPRETDEDGGKMFMGSQEQAFIVMNKKSSRNTL